MTKPNESPWACIKCNQLNANWAVKCGRCGAPMRTLLGVRVDDPNLVSPGTDLTNVFPEEEP